MSFETPGAAESAGDDGDLLEYAFRAYEPGDEEGIVDLHNEVWDGDRTVEWLRWKYVDNPYLDRVPVRVVVHDGSVVAASGSIPYRMRAGEATGLGMLSGDLVVHPDHRRQGLFSGLFGLFVERHTDESLPADERSDFAFSYANDASRPGLLQMGWFDVSPRVTYYRVQDPRSYVRDRFGSHGARVLGPPARAGASAYRRWRDRTASARADVAVARHDDVPVDVLTALADRERPERVHPVYDEAFYRWRYGVDWTADATYVARRRDASAGGAGQGDATGGGADQRDATDDEASGRPIAAVITRRTRDDSLDATTVSLVHAVPLAGEEREPGIAAILDRIARDERDAAFLRAWNPVFPDRLLRERGFLPDDRLPLSWTTGSDLTLTAFAVPGGRFARDDLRASGPELWSLDK